MKIGKAFKAIAALLVLSSLTLAQGTIIGSPALTIDKAKFEESMTNTLDGEVMGYQYVLIRNGQVVSDKFGGMAQNAEDGNIPMKSTTPTNIGSLAKFFSGTALIGLMQKPHGQLQWDNGLTLQEKLDRPFLSISPDVWRNAANHPKIFDITLRQLLQHRTGFNDLKAGNRNTLGFLSDPDGFWAWQYNTRQYSNINFVFTGYMIPLYAVSTYRDQLNNQIIAHNMSEADADIYVKNTSGYLMDYLMRTRIWNKMSPKINPSCDGKGELGDVAAYSYPSKDATGAGFINSAMEKQGHCSGEGGYFMSARDVANYVAHFSSTNLIVNSEGRKAMFNESMNPNDRLVWTSASFNQWYADNFDMPRIAWSDGVTEDWRAVIVRLPMNSYAVVTVNSPEFRSSQLGVAVLNAFRAATQHNFN